jgi:hypothetical protein
MSMPMLNIVCTLLVLTLFACGGPEDKQLILGRWESGQDWFEYRADQTYNGGKSVMTMVNGFRYTIDPEKKELNMYTDQEEQTYYLLYRFSGKDTLLVRNRLSTDTHMVAFVRKAATEK